MNQRVTGHDVFYRQTMIRVAAHLQQVLGIQPRRNYIITRPTCGARVLAVPMRLNPALFPKITPLAEQLSMRAGLDDGATIRIVRGPQGTIVLEIPLPEAFWRDVPVRGLPRGKALACTLGMDLMNNPVAVDFGLPGMSQMMVAGEPGSGKTNAARALFYALLRQNGPEEIALLLMDVSEKRGLGWRDFQRAPQLAHPVISDRGEALGALLWAKAQIADRSVDGRTTPAIFLGIDEAQAMYADPALADVVATLVATGREFGIHCIALQQNPVAKQMGFDTTIRRNMTVRLVGRTDSADAAEMAVGIRGTGAEYLMGGGDMLLRAGKTVRRLTVALVTPSDLERFRWAERAETRRLDLEGLVDADVIPSPRSAGGGRHPDALDPDALAWIMAHPTASQRAAYAALRIGFEKIKALQGFGLQLARALQGYGIYLCSSAEAGQGNATADRPDRPQNV